MDELEEPEFDNSWAIREHWFISRCYGSVNGNWQIQKDDEADKFDNDEAVWKHVCQLADLGSAYHRAALAFIHAHNPKEWLAITNHA